MSSWVRSRSGGSSEGILCSPCLVVDPAHRCAGTVIAVGSIQRTVVDGRTYPNRLTTSSLGSFLAPERACQTGGTTLAVAGNLAAVIRQDLTASGFQTAARLRVAVEHETATGSEGEDVAAHRGELLIGHLDEAPVALAQLVEKGDGHQRWKNDGEIGGDGTDQGHEMKALGRSVPVGEVVGQDLDLELCEDRAKLADARLVGAVAPADGKGAVVEPERVATLDHARFLDDAEN